ncbi:MAG TPA: hypothetical protein VGK89_14460 [Candidatus Eisenbacteria bacterium]|jgi:hypothetical protein
MILKRIAGGIASYVPGFNAMKRKGTGGSDSARYCYSVWLRHLLLACEAGMPSVPKSIAELGPGDSLGAGLAALLSGASRYTALDRTVYAFPERNLAVFEELVALFRNRAEIPGDAEFPLVWPPLAQTAFPTNLVTDERLVRAPAPARLEAIRDAIRNPGGADACLRYVAPWNLAENIVGDPVEFLFSQAVLEHVDDVPGTHRFVHTWLKPGGFASHTIDFCCHGLDPRWNAHWTYSPLVWKLIQGRRPWRLNRQPYSLHLRALAATGFEVVYEKRRAVPSAVRRDQLAGTFRDLPESDLETNSVTMLLRKS